MRRSGAVHFKKTDGGDVLTDGSGSRLHVPGAGSGSGGSQGGSPSGGGAAPIAMSVSPTDLVVDGMLGGWSTQYTDLPDVLSLGEGERPGTAMVASEPLIFIGSMNVGGYITSDVEVGWGGFTSGLWATIGSPIAKGPTIGEILYADLPVTFRLDTNDHVQLGFTGLNVQSCVLQGAIFLLGPDTITY
jgi:hypothetical protein